MPVTEIIPCFVFGRELYLANVTLGNYCSVDLVYPANPAIESEKENGDCHPGAACFQKGEKLCSRQLPFL